MKVQLGEHEVQMWSPKSMPNVQVLYLRLPDGGHAGQGYDAHGNESLKKLYNKDIESIATTDGNATYTLDAVKDIIATVLRTRKARDVKILYHKGPLPRTEEDFDSEHADHTICAKLVMDVIETEAITVNVKE